MQSRWLVRVGVAFMAVGAVTAQTDLPAFESAISSLLTIWDSVVSSLEAIPTEQPSTSTTFPVAITLSTLAAITTSSSTIDISSTTPDASSASSTTLATPTTLPTSSTALASTAASAAPVSSLTPSSDTAGTSATLSSRTRDIIIGVTVPIGLIILAAITILLVVCCRRRRRRTRQALTAEPKYEETKFIGNHDWEYGDNSHHGFSNAMGAEIGSRDDPRLGTHSDVTPLMGSNRAVDERMTDRTSLPYPDVASNTSRPVSINRPITRKPVPNRASDGSVFSSASTHQRNSHNDMLLGAGVGGLAGAAVAHHPDNNRHSHPSPQYEHYHTPLSPLSTHRNGAPPFDDIRQDYFHWQPTRPSPPPFSPDDVGSNYRHSQRFSQGPLPTEPNTLRNSAPTPSTGILGPTADQRRSLQNRHSGGSETQDRRTSPSPRRRSLSGGGEVWQADSMFMPALSSQKRDSGGGRQYISSAAAPPLPSQRQRISDGSQTPLLTPPAAPYNRHLANARAIDTHNKTYGSNTDSSTSGDSWESAQAEIANWDDTDSGRYPRLNNGAPSSRMPLIPPRPVWQDAGQRRWSDEAQPKTSRYRPNYQRHSSGNERRQRLRFDEGSPEYYNESGLVGRAL